MFNEPLTAEETNSTSIDGEWFAKQVTSQARNDPTLAIELADEALLFFKTTPEPIHQATVLNESAYALYFLGRYTDSMERAKQAEIYSKSNNFRFAIARSKILQGNVLQAVGVYQHALAHYQEAATVYRTSNDKNALSRVLNNIANTHYNASQYTVAMDFYRQVGELAETNRGKAQSLLGIANTLSELGDHFQAIEHFKRAHQYYELSNDQLGMELALSGLGLQYIELEQYEKAIQLIDEALDSAKKGSRLFRQDNMLKLKSRATLLLDSPKEALAIAESAYEQAKHIGNVSQQIEALRAKSAALEKLGQVSESLKILRQAEGMDSELRNSHSETQLAVMQAVFNLEKKDHQIDLLSSTNTIQELEFEQQRLRGFFIFGGVIFIMTVAVFLYYRRTQARLLEEQKHISIRLRELDALKNQVMANTSHELRTPLNGIMGMTQLLLLSPAIAKSQEDSEKIKVIEECGDRLLGLVKDITDFSHLQAGQISIKPEAVNVKDTIDHTCQLLSQVAAKKSLKITTNIEPQLPFVWADKKRLDQILLNLVGNAIKFSHSGTIQISAQRNQDKIRFSIEDEGIGIPENKLDSIFEPFEQIDGSSSRENEGSGLGLPITKELLLLHKSKIEVKTELGKGATFSFTLPSYAADDNS